MQTFFSFPCILVTRAADWMDRYVLNLFYFCKCQEFLHEGEASLYTFITIIIVISYLLAMKGIEKVGWIKMRLSLQNIPVIFFGQKIIRLK